MVLVLPAELTQTQASACLAKLLPGVASAATDRVVLDASQLRRFDTSALAVLLACRRAAIALGKRLEVNDMPEQLTRLATLYGVEALLNTPLAAAMPPA